ncbi:glycosyltransferase family 2 protein [Mangrovimonas sp. DI 80]|uniref:glycosyltransferase family 2 protein n=1 Tax=Mangrovimonas sp. DI 80 TaxID=1779330 RepID=UPI0009789288|nr:glycosyltransferase family 2 protein [Mangrovimonas sp. DI 80]OMP29866.1 glycosyltransferase [Mangrovimonas sp. DI 80]
MIESNHNKTDISVVIPIHNEEQNIDELYYRLNKTVTKISENYEFIFINDGSKDASLLKLIQLSEKDNRVFYINFSRNFGHQIAVTAGLDVCMGNVTVIIDGDLQDPPELIYDLYEKYKDGYDVVYAKRIERSEDSVFKKTTAKLFYRTLKKITAIDIPLDTGDFRLIDKKVVKYLKQMPEQSKFLRGQIAWIGFKQTEVLFNRDKRKHGKTGYSFTKMIRLAMNGITSFSNIPLQLVIILGFSMSFIASLIIIYAFYSYFVLNRTITGWTSLIISSMLIGGIQLISIGIIGEYIMRINKNILKRPLYIVEHSNRTKNEISENR